MRRIRLVDATVVNQPGSDGTDWRVHLGFDLSSFQIDSVEVTSRSGGETFRRFKVDPGDVVVGDAAYSSCKGFQSVREAGGDFLARLNWRTVPLKNRDGSALDLFAEIRSLPEATPGDFPVLIAPEGRNGVEPIHARLVALRKSEPAAELARAKALRIHSKKSRTPNPRTLEAASYVLIVTSVSEDTLNASQVLEIYRLRWQIELVFKHLKTVLDLDELNAKDKQLARTFLYSKLLIALLLENLTDRYLSFSPWGFRLARSLPLPVAHSSHTA